MPSFEFADCPTRLDLVLAADGGVQSGSLKCTLRNSSTRRQTARIRIEPLGGARPEWFTLAGAAPTSPLEIEQDIDAGNTLTVEAAVKIRPQAAAGSHSFRLRVTSESAPDTDFAEGPAVAFEVAAPKAPEPKPTKFPWWAIAAAVVLLVVIGGAVAFLAWPKGLDVALVKGKPFAEAKAIAAAKGFPDIKAEPGKPGGYDPAQQIVVDVGKDASGATVLLVDPGVAVPELARASAVDAARKLIDIGILPNQNPQFDSRSDFADGVVTRTIPPAPTPVALGGSVTIVLNNKPNGGGGPVNPCLRNIRDCVQIDRAWNKGIFSQDIQRQLIRPGQ